MNKHETQPTLCLQRHSLYMPILISLGLVYAIPVLANPNGGVVVGGQGTINQSPGVTTIDQSSSRAIINWKDFSINVGEVTRFNQPGKNAIALNRVLGNEQSSILGQLGANGQVWLVNRNGILFGPRAQVDVHGILATTSDIADLDFLAGRYDFSIPSPNTDASVVNHGLITIGQHGFGGLVAPHVRNSGVIRGRLGQVVIAGTPTFTLDYYGDGLIQFATTSKITENEDSSRALVQNDGTISVDGGDILLTANAAAGVVEEVINTSGIIEARSFAVENGTIVLMGGDEGIVNVAGRLDASGAGEGAAGGSVDVLGDQVLVAKGSNIDVSGAAGGGEIHIGGDLHGKGDRKSASLTTMASGAQINADAKVAGDGGQVVIWADDTASIHGEISAKGGAESGDGGFIETSGKNRLILTSTPDASASNGSSGEWLIDPANVTIVSGSPEDYYYDCCFLIAAETVFSAGLDLTSSYVYADSISRALSLGTDVIIDTSFLGEGEGQGNITQNSDATIIVGNFLREPFATTLTMNAENSIFIKDSIRVAIDNEAPDTKLNLVLDANSDRRGGGAIVLDPGSLISTNGGDVRMSGVGTADNTDGIALRGATIRTSGGDVALTGTGFAGKGSGNGLNIGNAYLDDYRVSSEIKSGSGDITLIGTGGAGSSDYNRGISIHQNSTIAASGAGNIALIGRGGTGTDELSGIHLDTGSDIRSEDGNISFTGYGGSGSGFANRGVNIQRYSIVESTGAGNIIIEGTAGTGTHDLVGTFIGTSIVRSADGDIDIAGIGGDGSALNNRGVHIQGEDVDGYIEYAVVESTAKGNIRIKGAGGGGTESNIGTSLEGAIISSASGDITLVGTGGKGGSELNRGIYLGPGADIASGGGIQLEGSPGEGARDSIHASEGSYISTSGLTNLVAGVGDIDLSAADSNFGKVSIQSAGNAFIADNYDIELGDMKVSGDLSVVADRHNEFSSDSIKVSGSISAGSSIYLQAQGGISVLQSGSITGQNIGIRSAYESIYIDGPVRASAAEPESNLYIGLSAYNGSFSNSATISVDSGYPGYSRNVVIAADDIYINGDINASGQGRIFLDAACCILQEESSVLTAEALYFGWDYFYEADPFSERQDDGLVRLNGSNRIKQLSASGRSVNFEFSNSQDLLVSGVSAETVFLDIDGTLTLDGSITGRSEGDAIVIHANKFINTVAPEYGLQTQAGRFLAYLEGKPGGDSRGNLDEVSTIVYGRSFETDKPDTITEAGNLFLYDIQAILKVIANNLVVEYGEPVNLSGFIDQEGLLEGDTLAEAVAGEPKFSLIPDLRPEVGVSGSPYVILSENGTLTSPLGYDFEFVNGELRITPAPLTLSLKGATREYGEPNSAIDFDIAYAGFKFNQGETDLGPLSFVTRADEYSPVAGNSYEISLTGFENTNYRVAPESIVDGKLFITPAPLLVRLDGAQREYGDANALIEFDAAFEGFKLEEGEAVLGPLSFVTDAVQGSHVADSPYDIRITGFENTDYQIAEGSITNGPLFIAPAPLVVLGFDARREYGDPNSTIRFEADFGGFKLGEGEADLGTLSFVTDAVQSSHVSGSPYDIRITGFDNVDYRLIGGSDEGSGYVGDLFITPAPLLVRLDGAQREYGDENTTIEFDASYEGFKLEEGEADLGSFSFITEANQNTHVAEKPHDIRITGFENTDYRLDPDSQLGSNLLITPAPLVVLLEGAQREYGDENTTIEFDASYDGFKLEEGEADLSPFSFITEANQRTHVAEKPHDIRITGFENTDYRIDPESQLDSNLLITPAPLLVRLDGAQREYGDENITIEFDASYEGFKLEEGEADLGPFSFITEANQHTHVAEKPHDIRITGFENTDYRLDPDSQLGSNLLITPAPLLVRLDGAQREYGDENITIEFDASYEGFKLEEGEADLGPFSFITEANQHTHVAEKPHDIRITGFENTDYRLDPDSQLGSNLLITPAPLVVLLEGAQREYGDENTTIEFDASYEGFKLEEGEADLGPFSFITEANQRTHVAEKPHDIRITGFENTDYRIDLESTLDSNLIITPAPLLVRLDGAQREYGDENTTIEFDASYEGFKLEEGEADLGPFSFITEANQHTHVAEKPHDIRITGFENTDYRIAEKSKLVSELLITPAPLSVLVNNASREYGDDNPAFSANFAGFKLNQSKSDLGKIVITTDANKNSPVVPVDGKPYNIDLVNFANTNYVANKDETTPGTLTIEKAPLTIVADDMIRGFGVENPEYTVSIEGLKLDDTPSIVSGLSFASDARKQSRPGVYGIFPQNGAASNYEIQHVEGSLVVTAGNIPNDDINIIPKTQPGVPLEKSFMPQLSAIPYRSFNDLLAVSSVELLSQSEERQLSPQTNKLDSMDKAKQDDLLFSNDGNHELWEK